LLLVWPSSARAGRWVLVAASLGMLLTMLRLLDIRSNLSTILMAFGAGGWAFGHLLWLGEFQFSTLLPAWTMFVVLMIAGERFEWDCIHKARRWMLVALYGSGGLILIGALLAPLNSNLAVRSSGLGCLILAFWLLAHDPARDSIHMRGLSRFSSLAVLTSLGWLGLFGVLALRFGMPSDAAVYDAMVHSLFLGFAGGMIVAHAPIILPAILGRKATYQPWLGMVVVGLHISIALRVISGLLNWQTGWRWGGLLSAAFGLVYIALLILRLWSTRHRD
jgi:hypothetical protein